MTEGKRVAKKGWWEVDGLDVIWKSAAAALVTALTVFFGGGTSAAWAFCFAALTPCWAGLLHLGLTSTKKAKAKRAALEKWDAAVAKAERDAWADEIVSRAVDEALAAGIPTIPPGGESERLSAMRIRPPAEVPKYGEGGQVAVALAVVALMVALVGGCWVWFGWAGLAAGAVVATVSFCAGAAMAEVGYRDYEAELGELLGRKS